MRKQGICAYCGEKDFVESDHVPPRGFFSKPLPSVGIITVPCCDKCNDRIANSRYDETVRNIISYCADSDHPAIVEDISRRRIESLRWGRQSNLSHLLEITELLQPVTDSGIYLPEQPAFDLDIPRFNIFFDRMTRALHYYETGEIINEQRVEWEPYPSLLFQKKEKILEILERAAGKINKIGTFDEFIYARFQHPELKSYFWIMWFYEKLLVFTWTKPSKRIDQEGVPDFISP